MDAAVEERVANGPWNPWLAEHRARYSLAGSLLGGAERVLDVACGSGLGAEALADVGRLVVGTDISVDAVRQAADLDIAGYHVVRSDGTQLPFSDASMDAVVSFETIEHIPDDSAFLAEVRRVLRPEGSLVISTPNALITQPLNGVPRNPYHVREYLPDEFRAVLRAHFGQVSMLGQRTSDAYGPCPYWEGPAPRAGLRTRTTSAAWKVIVRMPGAEVTSRLLLRRGLYPSVDDFVFVAEDDPRSHVLVGVCRP